MASIRELQMITMDGVNAIHQMQEPLPRLVQELYDYQEALESLKLYANLEADVADVLEKAQISAQNLANELAVLMDSSDKSVRNLESYVYG